MLVHARVRGRLLVGRSTKLVYPPAAGADEPLAVVSPAVRPGSLKWTCESMPPGKTCGPEASICSFASSDRFEPTAVMRPSVTATSARRTDELVTTVPPRMTRSLNLRLPAAPGTSQARRSRRQHRLRPRTRRDCG